MSEDLVKRLEGRIIELENQLKEMQAGRQRAANFTDEELQAYRKVRDALALDPDTGCGINECSRCLILRCRVCDIIRICSCIHVCDIECICGPCNCGISGFSRSGSSRFGGLGD